MSTQNNALQTSPNGREFVRPAQTREPRRLVLEFHNDNGVIKAEVTDLYQPAAGHTLTTSYLPKDGQAFRIGSGETWECEVASGVKECSTGWLVFVQPLKRLRQARSCSAPISSLLSFNGVKRVAVEQVKARPTPIILRSLTDPDFVPEGANGGGKMAPEVAVMLRTPPPVRGAAVKQIKKNGQAKSGKKK